MIALLLTDSDTSLINHLASLVALPALMWLVDLIVCTSVDLRDK